MSIVKGFMVPHPPLIIPEVGRGEEKGIEDTVKAYEYVGDEIARIEPETIIVSSPHSLMYSDYFHISGGTGAYGDMSKFGVPEVSMNVDYDTELIDRICSLAEDSVFPAGTDGEKMPELDHATFIPLYFVNNGYRRAEAGKVSGTEKEISDENIRDSETGKIMYKIVRIGLSGYPLVMHYQLGIIVRKAVEELGRKVVWIASGDLSHKLKEDGPYGFDKNGPVYDERIMKDMGNADFMSLLDYDETFCEKAAECGHRSFTMMAGAFDGYDVTPHELSYEGPFGVGYGVCTFDVSSKNDDRHFLKSFLKNRENKINEKKAGEDEYVKLARKSLETYIKTRTKISIPDELPKEMTDTQAGAFVSLHEFGRLRGCIGTISPVRDCLAEEIIENAISAATEDPRFDEIRENELGNIEYSVDVLGPTEKIDSPDMLDVKRYGVVVTSGRKRGLLLPDLDGVDTVTQQINIAKQKAGIPAGEKDIQLERFEVVRHY